MQEDFISYLEYILLWISVGILVISGVYFLKKHRSTEESSQAWFYFGFALFCVCFSISRIFFLLADLTKVGHWPPEGWNPLFSDPYFYWCLAVSFGNGSVIFILFVIERYMVKKTGCFFSIVAIIGLLLAFIFPYPTGLYISYIFTPIGVLGILGLYGYLIKRTSGIIRRRTIYAFLGIFILFFGFIIDTELGKSLLSLPYELIGSISSLLMIAGILIFVQGYR